MGKYVKWLVILCLLLSLSVGAVAASEVTQVQSGTIIGTDGSCAITVTLHLHLEQALSGGRFPLPEDAQNVQLGAGAATTEQSGGKLWVRLPDLPAGTHVIALAYHLPQVVSRENGQAQIHLPLLSGFSYPIREMTFSVTLPGEITGKPQYTSGYYQGEIEGAIQTQIHGNTLTATFTQPLKDHETLLLTLQTEEAMFPQVSDGGAKLDFWDGAVLVLLTLAILYYVLTLMPQWIRRKKTFTPPDGLGAGEVGACLTGSGVDLTLMVLTWAQLGYLQLELRGNRKVLLRKQMEMGNERSQLEVNAFRSLFAKQAVVEGTGVRYAQLHRKLALQSPVNGQYFRPNSGRPWIFRVLCCGAGAISGVKLGMALSTQPVMQVLLSMLCFILCGVFSYWIQAGGKCLPLRRKAPLWVALGCSAVWLLLGHWGHRVDDTVPMVCIQLFLGIAIAFGGRRNELGKRGLAQIQGLRRYMCRASTFELQQRLQANSNYFYSLLPYALALGVDKRFARRFGKTPMPECGFIVVPGRQPTTAQQWAVLLRQITNDLDARQRRLPYDRLTGRI